MARVLVDTSAWVDFFRRKEPCHGAVIKLMDNGAVCSVGIVLAELLQGAKSEKEIAVLKDFIHVFEFIPESAALWEKAGELSYALARKGKSAGLSDCYIAVAAASAGAALFTLDRHFQVIKSMLGLSLYEVGEKAR